MQGRKKEIRMKVLTRRRAMPPEEAEARSEAVVRRLWESGLLEGRDLVALYAAADNEVQTRALFEELGNNGVRVAMPRVRGRGPEIDFFEVSEWDSMKPSPLKIPEPQEGPEPVRPEEFDLVLVPGVAFDRHGGRLGYGMGCYDRVLENVRPGTPLVGVGYDFQIIERVPVETHDVPLTVIVCESETALPGNPGGRSNIQVGGAEK